MTDNPSYIWRPDPKGENLPETLFGMPIHLAKGTELKENTGIVLGKLGDFSHYIVVDVNGEKCLLSYVRGVLNKEELRQLLLGRSVVIDNTEEGEMTEGYTREECLTITLGFQTQLGEVLKERDAARAVLRKIEWVPHVTAAGVLWKCEVCHGWKDDGHTDDCELQAALW